MSEQSSMTLTEALAVCDQASPLPSYVRQALNVLRQALVEQNVADLARTIADKSARSDIECYAHYLGDGTDPKTTYDITKLQADLAPIESEVEAEHLKTLMDAFVYLMIRAHGGHLPFDMNVVGNMVQFIERIAA